MACDLRQAFVMRIRVSAIHTAITDEKRAYAEYRFFSSIAPYETQVRTVDVVVTAAPRQFLCTVSVDLGAAGRVETQAKAMHPSAAIDRAADRTAWLVDRRTAGDFTLKSASFTS